MQLGLGLRDQAIRALRRAMRRQRQRGHHPLQYRNGALYNLETLTATLQAAHP